jgi:hypothetical protein
MIVFVKKSLFVLVIALTLLLTGKAALAWEFSMSGAFMFKYNQFSQLGSNGFFGPFNVDNGGTSPDAAVANAWLGGQNDPLVSGADNALGQMSMLIFPDLRLNKAIRVRGQYRIGSWFRPDEFTSPGRIVSSKYRTATAVGLPRSISPGYWEALWISSQTPWGTVVLGKRPHVFGTGLFYDGSGYKATETLALISTFGPFRFGFGFYPWRTGLSQFLALLDSDLAFVPGSYYALSDKTSTPNPQVDSFVTYSTGPLQTGAIVEFARARIGPEGTARAITVGLSQGRDTVVPQDAWFMTGGVFVKYFNGRFFFNAEFDWANGVFENQPTLSGNLFQEGVGSVAPPADGSGSPFGKKYIEQHWRVGTEFGACVGPAKLSVMWAWIPGPDRRHGILIDRQSAFATREHTNTNFFKPYSLLLNYSYGTGNKPSLIDLLQDGYVTDANLVGTRIDFGVAANLNLYASLLWAERVSHGYGWGYVGPELDADGVPTGLVDFSLKGSFTDPAPAIPDSGLGWEIDWGFNWQLLEGYRITGDFGVWWPGGWFNYACIDRSNPGWKTPNSTNYFGVNPNRTIDPIFGMEIQLNAEF